MKSFKHARLAVAVALAACGAMGGMVASQRTGAAMAKNAQAFLDSLTPSSARKRRIRSIPRTARTGISSRRTSFHARDCRSRR